MMRRRDGNTDTRKDYHAPPPFEKHINDVPPRNLYGHATGRKCHIVPATERRFVRHACAQASHRWHISSHL
eukprot:SAG31_NODE_3386_length_4331_cov_2.421786_6_plen_71_part_00